MVRFAFALLALFSLSVATAGAADLNPAALSYKLPEKIPWIDEGHGSKSATLVGDPSKAGLYIMLVKWLPHNMSRPHWHPHDRYVTVLQGTWYTGTGDTFDPARAVPLKAGSFMFHPAKASHWDGSAGDETVIVQIMGEGPGTATQVDPKQPDWIEVHR